MFGKLSVDLDNKCGLSCCRVNFLKFIQSRTERITLASTLLASSTVMVLLYLGSVDKVVS